MTTEGLLGSWDLDGSPMEAGGCDGGVLLSPLSDARYTEVCDVPALSLRDGRALRVDAAWGRRSEFAVSMWVCLEGDAEHGSLLSCFDPLERHGLNLVLLDGHSTTSRSNAVGVELGVDWGAPPVWETLGRPPGSTGILAVAVHHGELHVGTLGDDGVGRVFRWSGAWVELAGVTEANCVSALASHRGRLYAGTTRYRTGGSAIDIADNDRPGGEVRVFDETTGWSTAGGGRLHGVDGITALTVHAGRLHAAAMYQEGIWLLDGERWRSLGSPGRRVLTMGVHDGRLHVGGNDHADPDSAIDLTRQGVVVEQRDSAGGGGVFALGDDSAWQFLGFQEDTTQIYSLTTHRGELYASTWPNGLVYRHTGGTSWQSTGRLGEETEVMGLTTYNGTLYGGTLPHAQLHRHAVDGWSLVGTLDVTPQALYRRAAGMAVHGGKLMVGTLPSGAVHAMGVGDVVTHDRSLRPGWHHVVASCGADRLALWVDGEQIATVRSDAAPARPLPDAPLVIGAGSRGGLNAEIRNLRVFGRALGDADIVDLLADDPRLDQHAGQAGRKDQR